VKHLPNIISMARILLVAPIMYFLWQQQYQLALISFLIAGISDGLDGFLARRFGWQTPLGTYLDPIGDKLLLMGCYLLLGMLKIVPLWLVLLVIGRDILIVIGAALYRYAVKDAAMQPLRISKINTVMQILLVLVLLYKLSTTPALMPYAPDQFDLVLIVAVAFTTAFSGVAYVAAWGQRIMQSLKKRQPL